MISELYYVQFPRGMEFSSIAEACFEAEREQRAVESSQNWTALTYTFPAPEWFCVKTELFLYQSQIQIKCLLPFFTPSFSRLYMAGVFLK